MYYYIKYFMYLWEKYAISVLYTNCTNISDECNSKVVTSAFIACIYNMGIWSRNHLWSWYFIRSNFIKFQNMVYLKIAKKKKNVYILKKNLVEPTFSWCEVRIFLESIRFIFHKIYSTSTLTYFQFQRFKESREVKVLSFYDVWRKT